MARFLVSNDDFIVPHTQDTDMSCTEIDNLLYYDTALPVTACLSILCYIYLFWMYFGLNSPVFNRHPTSKIFRIFFLFVSFVILIENSFPI
jgi:hypothetical protein